MVWQGIRDPDHGEERKEMAGGSLPVGLVVAFKGRPVILS